MAKTFTNLTAVATGDVLTATNYNNAQTTLNNHTVPPMVRISLSAGQSIANSTWTFVTGWGETFDTDSIWTSPNNYIEIQTAGVYLVQYGGAYTSNSTGARLGGVSLNDATPGNAAIHIANLSAASTSDTGLHGSFIYNFAALDKLRFQTWQNSTAALLLGTATNGYAYMSALFVGKTA